MTRAYSDEQWARIEAVVDTLGPIENAILLRERVEAAAEMYHLHRDSTRRSLSPAGLRKLRKDAESLRTRVEAAFFYSYYTMRVAEPFFDTLRRNLDGKLAQERGPNAQKHDRDWLWRQLLAIWCALDGKPHGKAAAKFLWEASEPVLSDDDMPEYEEAIVLWLDRRRNKPARRRRPVLRRAAG